MSKVFVIDDSVSACVAIERMLGNQGFDVVWEMDAVTALSTVEKHHPDLVICDLVLPEISGYEICQSLRDNPLLDDVPVLLISGDVDDAVRRRARECNAAGIIAKPFTATQLLEEVQAMLGAIDSVPREEPPESASMALRHRIAAELDAFAGLDYRYACVRDSDGQILAASGRASPDALTPDLKRELAALVQIAGQLVDESPDDLHTARLTLETSSGVRLVDSLEAGCHLIVILTDSSSLGKSRYLMKKVRAPLSNILRQDSFSSPVA